MVKGKVKLSQLILYVEEFKDRMTPADIFLQCDWLVNRLALLVMLLLYVDV